jgi:CheY-like chemotaxis protein
MRAEFRLRAPLAALGLGLLLAGGLLAWSQFTEARARTAAAIARIDHALLLAATSEETAANLGGPFDLAWADAKLGDALARDVGFEHLFVLDGDNRPIYGRSGAQRIAPSGFSSLTDADVVIAQVRRAEARGLQGPVQASRIAGHGDKARLITAALVQRDRGHSQLTQPYAPILIAAVPLDHTPGGLRPHHLIAATGILILTGLLVVSAAGRARRTRHAIDSPLAPEPEALSAEFHLASLVRQVTAQIAPLAEDKGLDLILDISPAAERLVTGDAGRLRDVLLALLSRAVTSTSEGYVAIAAHADAGARWRIEVQDTGIGFAPADAGRLFTDRFPDLAAAQRVAMLMGGEIGAVGAPGRGATFTVHALLPPAAELLAADLPADHRMRVLLADDQPIRLKAAQVLLTELGVDVVCAENGDEAALAFATQRFDLILIDEQISVRPFGLQAIRERERANRMPRTPAVMLMAADRPAQSARATGAGADLHMVRPLQPAKLQDILKAIAEHQGLAAAA